MPLRPPRARRPGASRGGGLRPKGADGRSAQKGRAQRSDSGGDGVVPEAVVRQVRKAQEEQVAEPEPVLLLAVRALPVAAARLPAAVTGPLAGRDVARVREPAGGTPPSRPRWPALPGRGRAVVPQKWGAEGPHQLYRAQTRTLPGSE